MTEKRKLAAILAADVVGFSHLTGSDAEGTLARLRTLWSDLIAPTISVLNGRVVKRTGDGSIIEFRSVVDAVRCAIEVQNGMVERNDGFRPDAGRAQGGPVVKAQDWTAAETALGVTAHPSNDASPCRTIRRGKHRPWISTKSLFMSASLAAFGRRAQLEDRGAMVRMQMPVASRITVPSWSSLCRISLSPTVLRCLPHRFRGRQQSSGARLYSQHGAPGGQRHRVLIHRFPPFREVASPKSSARLPNRTEPKSDSPVRAEASAVS
jgi:hypothetical protein